MYMTIGLTARPIRIGGCENIAVRFIVHDFLGFWFKCQLWCVLGAFQHLLVDKMCVSGANLYRLLRIIYLHIQKILQFSPSERAAIAGVVLRDGIMKIMLAT